MKNTKLKIHSSLFLLGVASQLLKTQGADIPAVDSVSSALQKPAWLTDLTLSAKESHDDNVLLVSGNGMQPQASWVSTVSPKVGFNFAPLLGSQKTLQTLSLVYAPEFNIYGGASSQNYNAHKIGNLIKGQAGDCSYTLDNAFLYNDGSHQAPIYALNQLPGAGANQFDQFRNSFANSAARERVAQTQDRATIALRYDWGKFLIRPAATLLDYNLMTDWHNATLAPWKGYQNYVDRYDVNGGMDVGYKLTPELAVTLGYRYGSQYQQQLPGWVSPLDRHYSSSDYQRVLLGLEGKPWNWLAVTLAGGPDIRDYNSMTPVADHNPIKYYGEAVLRAILTSSQTLTFNYKQWQWVGSTGKVPEFESNYALTYHWNATRQLSLDLGGKIQEEDFTEGNDYLGVTEPSRRNDMKYEVSAGATYAFNAHFSASLAYTYDQGENALHNLPADLAPTYRNFEHQVVSLGLKYSF